MSTALLALAAGLGTRFGDEKALAEVGPHGETLLDYTIYDALRAGITHVVLVIRPEQKPAFREHFRAMVGRAMDVEFVYQRRDDLPPGRTKPWGTGHALLSGAGSVGGTCIAINADDLYGAEAISQAAAHLGRADPVQGGRHALIAYALANTAIPHSGGVSRAVVRTESGLLIQLEETREIRREGDAFVGRTVDGAPVVLEPSTLVSMNLWAFRPEIFDVLHRSFGEFLNRLGTDRTAEFFIGTAVNEAIAAGNMQVHVYRMTTEAWGVTWPSDTTAARDAIRALVDAGRYPARLADGFAQLDTA